MKKQNFFSNLNQVVKGLAVISAVIIFLVVLVCLGVASGSIVVNDHSSLSELTRFLINRPYIIGAISILMVWGFIIALWEESMKKREENERTKLSRRVRRRASLKNP